MDGSRGLTLTQHTRVTCLVCIAAGLSIAVPLARMSLPTHMNTYTDIHRRTQTYTDTHTHTHTHTHTRVRCLVCVAASL